MLIQRSRRHANSIPPVPRATFAWSCRTWGKQIFRFYSPGDLAVEPIQVGQDEISGHVRRQTVLARIQTAEEAEFRDCK